MPSWKAGKMWAKWCCRFARKAKRAPRLSAAGLFAPSLDSLSSPWYSMVTVILAAKEVPMTEKNTRPVLPIYLAAAVWPLYALFFPPVK